MKNSTKVFIGIGALLIVGIVVFSIISMTNRTDTLTWTEFQEKASKGEIERVYIDSYVVNVKVRNGKVSDKNFPNKADYRFNMLVLDELVKYLDDNNANYTKYKDVADDIATLKTQLNLENEKPDGEKDAELIASLTKEIAALEEKAAVELSGFEKLRRIDVSMSNPNAGSIWQNMIPILGILGFAVLAFFMLRSLNSGNKQAMNFSKSKARLNANIKTRFSDVAGAEEEKTELAEVVEFLKNARKFEAVGAHIPKGVLLVGPPGTGKTLFAKAVAGEANVPFFSISGSDFVEMYVGVGASRVRDLFEDAKHNQPCIIFIDEIDAVGRQRGAGMGGGHDEREQTLNQLLVQMDGFEANSGVIVMAATNRADVLDPALLRPGRFDRQVYVNLPDVRGREEIFKVHSRNKPLASDVDFKILGRMTSGFSGADIENLLNEAAILAARANRTVITMVDLNEGVNKVVMGPQKKSRIVTEVDKRITAYHEAGHAIVARALKHCDPVHEVSIIPRGNAAGYTMTRPENDDNHVTLAKLIDDIAMTMGGRAAEEIVLKDYSTGAMGDIKMATERARKMVTEWGMSSELGPVFLGGGQEVFLGRDYQSTHSYSEEIASKIDKEIYRIVEDGHQTALRILQENREVMDKMVRLLIERETIYSEEVDALMAGKDVKEIEAQLDKRLNARSEAVKQAVAEKTAEHRDDSTDGNRPLTH